MHVIMTANEYRNTILNILVKIDSICRENNIDYFVCGGTLLGAIRHKGFIPWDDDIDIMMTYDNYDKLRAIVCSEDLGLNFIDIKNNKDTIFPYGKVCDSNTQIIKEANFRLPKGYGAFVDVFPIIYYSNDEKKRKNEVNRYIWYQRALEHNARMKYKKTGDLKTNVMRFVADNVCKLIDSQKLLHKMDERLRALPKTNWVGAIGDPPIYLYDEGIEDAEFEGHIIKIPKAWNSFLELLYGDYLTLPPENERNGKHNIECAYVVK